MRVAVSARIIDRNVGGNSRYARAIHGGDGDFESILLRPRGPQSTIHFARLESFTWPRSVQADALHFPADTGPMLRGRHTPIVTTIHGLGYRHVSGIRSPRAQFIWKSRVARAAAVSDHIITVSASSADDISTEFGINRSKITVIPHGVSPQFAPGPLTPIEREKLVAAGFPTEYILYVGNIEPRKNIGNLIAASEATFAETGVPLVVCGAPAWDFDGIIESLQNAPSVRYLGRISEDLLVSAYRGAKLFCFPSLYEGFGLPVLEAMAVGTPVACTRAGSLQEVADGATFAIKDPSASAIAQALRGALSSDTARNEMVEAGLERAGQFNWSRSLAAHKDVFENV